jgi:hypothetical protein
MVLKTLKKIITSVLLAGTLYFSGCTTTPAVGNLDLFTHYNGKTKQVEPYSEVWAMKQFSDRFKGEFYAETMAQDGDLTGIEAELLAYHDIGKGFAAWIEYLGVTNADDVVRGGLMWKKAWEDYFLMARIGPREGGDLTARLVFNKNLPRGSIGVLLNSASFENRHIHAEIPRFYWRINKSIGLIGEATCDYKKDYNNKEPEVTLGIRSGLRINF